MEARIHDFKILGLFVAVSCWLGPVVALGGGRRLVL